MRQDKVKQIICISEPNPAIFEERMNEALSNLVDPEVRIYESMPFTAVILYTVSRDMPEDVLELLEMVDGGYHTCIECPHYVKPTDGRRKWGSCSAKGTKTRGDSRACEDYYLLRYKMLSEAKDSLLESPFTVE